MRLSTAQNNELHRLKNKRIRFINLSILIFSAVFTFIIFPSHYSHAFADITVDSFTGVTGYPDAITTGPDGNLWFTDANATNSATDKIGKITLSGSITEYTPPSIYGGPAGITTGSDGNLWFMENLANKIGRVTTSGSFTEYSIPTALTAFQGGSYSLTNGPDGNIWFTEMAQNKIGKITMNGSITEYTIPTSSSEPVRITNGPDGNLWFTEQHSNQIGKITTSGTITEFTVPTSGSGLSNIISGPDGNLWFIEENGNKIGKITTSGTITEYTIPTSNAYPGYIASSRNGNLWFTEYGSNKIGQITTSGSISEIPAPSSIGNPDGITLAPDGKMWFTSTNVATTGIPSINRLNYSIIPTIFIPGVMGSDFIVNQTFYPNITDCSNNPYSYNQGDTVWESISLLNVASYSTCGKYLDALKLQNDGQTPVYSQVSLKGTAISPYNETISYLQQQGYISGTNLFVFTYDWRKDIASSMNDLDNLINEATASAGTTQVNIIAHSMGGLVSRQYISNSTRANKVNALVELGTPHAGSVDALATLLYPVCIKYQIWFLNPCVVNGNEVNSLVQNFTSAFELLPSELYYTLYSNLYPFKDTSDIDNNGVTGILSYDQVKTMLSNLGKNMTAFNISDSFHNNLDSTYSTTNGVKVYMIAGSGQATLGQLYDYVWSTSGVKHDAITTNGDGTVPLKSATLGETNGVYYAKTDHGGLVQSGPALKMAIDLINGQTGIIPDIQTSPYPVDGKIVSVHSPTQLDAYDASNNHTGINTDGSFEENIPGSEYFAIDDAKFIYLPDGGDYRITTKATDTGNFDLKVQTYTDDVISQQDLYLNIPQNSQTTSSMALATPSANLNVDVNGNGTNIQQVSPTYTLSGSNATDVAPPVTFASLTPTPDGNGNYSDPVTVTLTATASAGFSITNTYYKIDSGSQQTYTTPFTVTGSGNHTVTYWSVDNASLVETQNTKTFTTQSSIPTLIQKSFASDSNIATLSANVTNGDLILVGITNFLGNVSSVTDTQGNTYTAVAPAVHANSSSDFVNLYYAKNVTGGHVAVSVTNSGGYISNVGVYEYAGVNTSSPLDQIHSDTGYSSTPDGGTLTTTVNNELYFAIGADDYGMNSTPTAGSGYTLENHYDDSTNSERFYSEDRVSNLGSYSTNFTIGTASDWAVIGASFTPTGYSAPTSTPTPTAFPTPALVQSKKNGGGGGTTSLSTSFSSTPSAGDSVIVVVNSGGPDASTISVSDNQGNTYTRRGTRQSTPGGQNLEVFSASNVTSSGTFTVTVTGDGGTSWGADFLLLDVSGLASSGSYQIEATGSGTSTSPSTASATPSKNGAFILGVVSDEANLTTKTAGTGYTSIASENDLSSHNGYLAEYKIQNTASSTNATATLGSSANWVMKMSIFTP